MSLAHVTSTPIVSNQHSVSCLKIHGKRLLITFVALAGIALMTVGLLSHYEKISCLNAATQWSLIGIGALFDLTLIVGYIYLSRRSSNPFPNGKRANLDDESDAHRVGVYAGYHIYRAKQAIRETRATSHLFHFLDNPNKELVLTDSVFGRLETNLLPSLSECACTNSENFNRFKNSRRGDLENLMLKNAKALSLPSHMPLRYLSLGSGELLQDFINIGKLMRAGYRNIEVVLVDPQYSTDGDFYRLNPRDLERHNERFNAMDTQFKFLQAVAGELGVTLKIDYIDSISKAKGRFQIIQAIDFDDFYKAFSDVVQVHDLLADNGRYYLAYALYDLIFSKERCESHRIHNFDPEHTTLNTRISTHLREQVQQIGKKEIQVAFLSDEQDLEQWTTYLRAISENPTVEKISLTLLHPRERTYFGSSDTPNAQFTKANMEKFLSLLCGKRIEVTLVATFEGFQAVQQPYDIITQLYRAAVQSTLEPQVSWLRRNHATSSLTFALQGYDNNRQLAWEGLWNWQAASGIHYFSETTAAHQRIIASLMA